jgi:hypothetical protein
MPVCMARASSRQNQQPQMYVLPCACLPGPFPDFVPFADDPSTLLVCPDSVESNPKP